MIKKRAILSFAIAAILFLTSLTGCIAKKELVKTEYIRPTVPPLPAKPNYYPVKYKKVGNDYCFEDPESATNSLRNKTLQDGHEKDLEDIIEGMKTEIKKYRPLSTE